MPHDPLLRGILAALVAVFLALVVLSAEVWRVERAIEPIATSTIARTIASF